MEVIVLGVMFLGFTGIIIWDRRAQRYEQRLDVQLQTDLFERLMLNYHMIAREAMDTVKTTTVQEKVQAQTTREASNIQLRYLQDTIARQHKQEQEIKQPVKVNVTTIDGDAQTIDSKDLEII